MKNLTIIKIAKKANVHPDTIYKAARQRRASFKLAEKLERVTGINKLQFQYPDQFGDGWALLFAEVRKYDNSKNFGLLSPRQ